MENYSKLSKRRDNQFGLTKDIYTIGRMTLALLRR